MRLGLIHVFVVLPLDLLDEVHLHLWPVRFLARRNFPFSLDFFNLEYVLNLLLSSPSPGLFDGEVLAFLFDR